MSAKSVILYLDADAVSAALLKKVDEDKTLERLALSQISGPNLLKNNPATLAESAPENESLIRIEEALRSAAQAVTILALDNLSQLAIILLTRPELKNKIERIVLLEPHGRAQSQAAVDPESAAVVLASGVPICFLMAETVVANTVEALNAHEGSLNAEQKAEVLHRLLHGAHDFCSAERYVGINRDAYTTRGSYWVDGLQLSGKAANATVLYRYPFLI